MRAKSLAEFGLPVELAEAHAPVVLFDRVNLSFDDKVILRDVTFSVRAGHTKIFLGASGRDRRSELMLGLLKPDPEPFGSWVASTDGRGAVDARPHLRAWSSEGARSIRSRSVRSRPNSRRDDAADGRCAAGRRSLGFVGCGARRQIALGIVGRAAPPRRDRARDGRPPTLLLYDEATTVDPMTALTVDAEIVSPRPGARHVGARHPPAARRYAATHERNAAPDEIFEASGQDRRGGFPDDSRGRGGFSHVGFGTRRIRIWCAVQETRSMPHSLGPN